MRREIIIFLGVTVLLTVTGCAPAGKSSSAPTSSSSSQSQISATEIKTAQSSVAATIPHENSRTVEIGKAMQAYIISQKQGLVSAMPDQLKTYSYEDEEATDSRTITVNYIYRREVAVPSSSQVADFQANYQKEIQFILDDMAKAGIDQPRVQSIYYNKDGQYLYTLKAGAW